MTDLRWSAFFLAVVFFVSGAFADEFNPGLAETVPTVTGSQIQNGGSRKTVGAPASASQLAWASADGCDAFGLNQTGYAPTAMSSGTIYDAADSTADSQGGFDFVFSAGQLNFPELAIRISRVTDHTTVIPLMNLSTDPWAGQRRLRFVSRKIRSHNAVEDALPVPEPNTIGLCCLGVLIIAWRVQQRGTNRQSMPGDFACLSATPVWRYRRSRVPPRW